MTATISKPELKLSFLRKITYLYLNSLKKFCIGSVASFLVLIPITKLFTFIGEKLDLIKAVTRESNITGFIENLKKSGLKQFNTETLITAPSYLEEFARQYNSHFPSNPELHLTAYGIKVSAFLSVCVAAPLLEELLFRGLIQDKILGFVEKKWKEKYGVIRDVDLWISLRIGIAASLFSAYHLINMGVFADSYVLLQLFQTFILGIGFGILKESRLGLCGAIGAHAANNFFAIGSVLFG